MKEPPSVYEPPLAFQYSSQRRQNRLSSADKLSRTASITCFSEPQKAIATSPLWYENTCGRNILVSVIPINWCESPFAFAMIKNHGPSGEP